MIKCKTDSVMAVVGRPVGKNITEFNRSAYVITEDALREAFSKVKLPMPITLNYQKDQIVGEVTELCDSTFNGMFSIGAKVTLEQKHKYVSVGYRVNLEDSELNASEDISLVGVEIKCFAAFDETGYDDVAELQQLEK